MVFSAARCDLPDCFCIFLESGRRPDWPWGVLPVAPWLEELRNRFGTEAYRLFPTLCWFNSSDSFLHFLCAAGVALSLLLISGIAPVLCLLMLWAFYLSLCVAGQVFMNFQWDYLLLEVGFLSIFLAPVRLFPSKRYEERPSPWAHFLLRWLLFRLMLMSGVVKLTSGDESWWKLSALHYHYETQPLPTPLSWWANLLPPWFQACSTIVMFGVELGAPFLLFAPRRLRLIGVASLLVLQALIALTGNYCFFNLLTASLCLLAVDDAVWPRFGRKLPRASDDPRCPMALLVFGSVGSFCCRSERAAAMECVLSGSRLAAVIQRALQLSRAVSLAQWLRPLSSDDKNPARNHRRGKSGSM